MTDCFLSCLHGSELKNLKKLFVRGFLSCLHGSEQVLEASPAKPSFLSCLHGSELAPKTYNHLKEKEIPSFSLQKPSFFEVS